MQKNPKTVHRNNLLSTALEIDKKASRVKEYLESRIHKSFTEAADDLHGAGVIDHDERIELSHLIGSTLDQFGKAIEPEVASKEIHNDIVKNILSSFLSLNIIADSHQTGDAYVNRWLLVSEMSEDEKIQNILNQGISEDEKIKLIHNRISEMFFEMNDEDNTNIKEVEWSAPIINAQDIMKLIEEHEEDLASESSLNISAAEDNTQKWKGLRYDERTGKWEVYITQRVSETFDNERDAVSFLKKASVNKTSEEGQFGAEDEFDTPSGSSVHDEMMTYIGQKFSDALPPLEEIGTALIGAGYDYKDVSLLVNWLMGEEGTAPSLIGVDPETVPEIPMGPKPFKIKVMDEEEKEKRIKELLEKGKTVKKDSPESLQIQRKLRELDASKHTILSITSEEHPVVKPGQEELEGVKEVNKNKQIKFDKHQNKWKVDVTERADALFDNEREALDYLKKVKHIHKQEFVIVDDDNFCESDSNFKAIGKCTDCNTLLFPYSPDMFYLQKERARDAYCPNCGHNVVTNFDGNVPFYYAAGNLNNCLNITSEYIGELYNDPKCHHEFSKPNSKKLTKFLNNTDSGDPVNWYAYWCPNQDCGYSAAYGIETQPGLGGSGWVEASLKNAAWAQERKSFQSNDASKKIEVSWQGNNIFFILHEEGKEPIEISRRYDDERTTEVAFSMFDNYEKASHMFEAGYDYMFKPKSSKKVELDVSHIKEDLKEFKEIDERATDIKKLVKELSDEDKDALKANAAVLDITEVTSSPDVQAMIYYISDEIQKTYKNTTPDRDVILSYIYANNDGIKKAITNQLKDTPAHEYNDYFKKVQIFMEDQIFDLVGANKIAKLDILVSKSVVGEKITVEDMICAVGSNLELLKEASEYIKIRVDKELK